MGFSRQEYWRGFSFPSPGDLPNRGIEPRSPTLQADALTSVPPGKPGQGTLASCPRQEEIRDKRVPVAAARSGPLAGKLAPEYPEWSECQSQRRRVPTRVAICCRKADPFQGLKLGSCLRLGNELSEETHLLTKQEILLGKGTQVESRRVMED